MFKRVLLPVDLTESAMNDRAIAVAKDIAESFDSDIHVVNVQSLLPIAFLDYVPADFGEDIKRGLEKEIAAIAARIGRPAERISTAILYGPVYQNILSEAEKWVADAIVLRSHRTGMERFLIGSNASAVVEHANCSVLVVR